MNDTAIENEIWTPPSPAEARTGPRRVEAPAWLRQAIERIEGDARLDPAVERMKGVASLVGTGRRGENLRGVWLGHALHPLLTDFPLGCWMAANVLDLVGGASARPA